MKPTYSIPKLCLGIGELPKCDTFRFLSKILKRRKVDKLLKKEIKLNFRVTNYEEKIIRNKAAKAKISVSSYVRKAALDKNIMVIDGLREIKNELNGIGNNLNQQTIIMRANNGNSPKVEEMKNQFCEVMNLIKNILREEEDDGSNQDC